MHMEEVMFAKFHGRFFSNDKLVKNIMIQYDDWFINLETATRYIEKNLIVEWI